MKWLFKSLIFLILFVGVRPCMAFDLSSLFSKEKGPWQLPVELNDDNTEVEFTVETTIHTVRGRTSGITGRVWLSEENAYDSVRAHVQVPIRQFNTGNESRDGKLRRILEANQYPDVMFELSHIENLCNPQTLQAPHTCRSTAIGELSMKGNKQEIMLDLTIYPLQDGFQVKGISVFRWKDFDVEDPSTFLAKVYDDVQVTFILTIK